MIDPALASFLQQGLSIHIATRDRDMVPVGARALALRVHEDGVHLTVYVARVAAERLLPQLDASRQLAINVGRPTDDRACQVKGVLSAVRDATDDEHAFVTCQWHGFLDQMYAIGVGRAAGSRWVTWPALAVRIRVTAVFEQTPGPLAGTALS